MRLAISCSLSTLLATSLIACGEGADGPRSSSDETPTTGGTFIVATAGEPDVIFPALAHTQQGRHVSDQVFDRLAEIGDSLNTVGDAGFEPRLARKWEWAADSLSIAFELDPRARWHDGRPVRASDVRFSWAVSVDPKVGSATAGLLASVDSVQVRDTLTAVVWYKSVTPEQFFDFVYQVPIVPEHVYGAVPREGLRTADVMRRPIGSGRFRFAKWDAGQRLELIADTANYRGRARLDRVVYVLSQDFDASLTRLLAKEADFMENVLPDHAARLRADSALRVVRYPGLQTAHVLFNQRKNGVPHPIFSDRAVRLALSMAVDRQAMLRNVFDTLGTLAVGPLPRAHPLADASLRIPSYDTLRAAQLLDSAGWRRGPDGIRTRNGRAFAFSILVPSSSKARSNYAVLLQEAFQRAGAKVTIESVDYPTFFQRSNGQFDLAITGIGVDPSGSTLRQYWTAATAGKAGGNSGSYSNPAFESQLDSALDTRDPARMRATFGRAVQQIADDTPAIWLYDVLTMAAGHKRIRAANMRADAWWADLADWWIPDTEKLPRDKLGVAPATASR